MKKMYGAYIKFIVYAIAVVLINLAGMNLFFRADLTANKIYSLSKASKEAVATLSEPLTVNVFFTRDLPAPYNTIERYLHDLLEEYAIASNRYFNYRFYDVSPEESAIGNDAGGNRELARSYGIRPVQIQHIEQDEVKFKNAYMGLVIIHGDLIERIPTITSTDGLEYALTTAMEKLNNKISALLNLEGTIDVTLYLSSSLEPIAPRMGLDELPNLPETIETIVQDLNRKNYDRLRFRTFDPGKDAGAARDVEIQDIMTLGWPSIPEAGIEEGTGSIGLVMSYGGKSIETPLLNVVKIPIFGTQYSLAGAEELEDTIDHNIESLIGINENLGYLADHGTPVMSEMPPIPGMEQPGTRRLSNFSSLAGRTYSIEEVTIGDDPIPDTFNCLIIAGPRETFTDYELYRLDQYLMRGKTLAVFADAFEEQLPDRRNYGFGQQPTYVPLDTGLEKLLAHYGVTVERSYVMDENCFRQRLPRQFGGGERPLYFAPIILDANINHDLPVLETLKGFVVLKISPLTVSADKKRIQVTEIFTSSDRSWEMKDAISLNPLFIEPPPESEDERGRRSLGYLLEGTFTSYFKGKPIPERATSETGDGGAEGAEANKAGAIDPSRITGEGTFVEEGKEAKILVIASSELLTDNMIDEAGLSTNAMLVMNLIDYLNGRSDIAVMRSKEQKFNPLHETDAIVKTAVKTLNIAGLPVLVVLFGLIVWWHRAARKKHIQYLFEK
ncbi:MAG: Gldg family protein [Deltaproteobacteria bacterium]|nr:Gldg family protein [Deltaproteobacteria bacterium]